MHELTRPPSVSNDEYKFFTHHLQLFQADSAISFLIHLQKRVLLIAKGGQTHTRAGF